MNDKATKKASDGSGSVNSRPSERRGYTAQNPEPLNPQELKPPRGDTAVQPPKDPPSKN